MTEAPRTTSDNDSKGKGKAIAVVSGKGGSGKTMLAVALAQGLALMNREVLLIDTDFGTGGLTYYLTFRAFQKARVGLADLILAPSRDDTILDWAAHGRPESSEQGWLHSVRLVPVGDQRRIGDDVTDELLEAISSVLWQAREIFDVIIVDCRGGIDQQSLAVCDRCDEILVVVETDTTSIQASQHLMDTISRRNLSQKVAGFVLNKVMDDPSVIAKTASSLLKTDYLGAVPFDIDATRAYIQGSVPSTKSLFSVHAFAILPAIFRPAYDYYVDIKTLSPEEFSTVTLKTPELRYGALVVAVAAVYAVIAGAWLFWSNSHLGKILLTVKEVSTALAVVAALVVAALSDRVKQSLGRIVSEYIRLLTRTKRRSKE